MLQRFEACSLSGLECLCSLGDLRTGKLLSQCLSVSVGIMEKKLETTRVYIGII